MEAGVNRKVRFALVGSGWRADFFQRIAKELPEQFEITMNLVHTKERAMEIEECWKVPATTDIEAVMETKPEFVVICVPKAVGLKYAKKFMKKSLPILYETPAATNKEELDTIWALKKKYNARIQVAEQYLFQPQHAAMLALIQSGVIGEVTNMSLSVAHGYHGVSMIRKMLGVDVKNCKLTGRRFRFPVTVTNGRNGADRSGKQVEESRDMVTMEFEGGKVAFFDFSNQQYFSHIRRRRINLRGTSGEIDGLDVSFLDVKFSNANYPEGEYFPVVERLRRVEYGGDGLGTPSLEGIAFGREMVYRNPFFGARFNDDEIAIATCLVKMGEYVATDIEFYSLKEAIMDTYTSLKMEDILSESY